MFKNTQNDNMSEIRPKKEQVAEEMSEHEKNEM